MLTCLPSSGSLDNCEKLICSFNQLTQIKAIALTRCIKLKCQYNCLTELPELPQCTRLNTFNNPL